MDLEREGKRMNNCLANEVAEVREGRRANFRWLWPDPATVQLLRSTSRWHLEPILGPRNWPLSSSEAEPIVGHAKELIAAAGSDLPPPREDSVSAVVSMGEEARKSFSVREFERVGTALREIHRKSKGPGPETNAYCIVEDLQGYIQFMDLDGNGELLCEIQSHRFSAALEGSMTNDIVDLIEKAGFSWPAPHAEQNFVRRIPVRSDLEIDALAGFALGVLAEVFGFRSGKPLGVKVHLPWAPRRVLWTKHVSAPAARRRSIFALANPALVKFPIPGLRQGAGRKTGRSTNRPGKRPLPRTSWTTRWW